MVKCRRENSFGSISAVHYAKGISMIETKRDFIDKIEGLGIEYMVTGSYAMSA
jgi:hypothetical protein